MTNTVQAAKLVACVDEVTVIPAPEDEGSAQQVAEDYISRLPVMLAV